MTHLERDSGRFWRAVHEVFDPIVPVTDPTLRAERGTRYNPMVELDRRLRLPIGHMCYAVAGGVGSGKSTELLATAGRLTNDALVVFVDLWRHFESSVRDPAALDHLQPWELVGLLGLALVRAGRERFGHPWKEPQDDLARALGAFGHPEPGKPSVDVSRLTGGLAVMAGGAVGAIAGTGLELLKAATDATTWNWKIGLRGRDRTSDQDQRVRRVLDATNGVIQTLRDAYQRKLILVIDGLDRVRVPATFEDLFVDSNLLRELACDVVVCAELALVQRYRSRMRITKTFEVTNIPVARRDDPTLVGDGVGFFHDLVRRRLGAPEVPLSPNAFTAEMIERLAWCSGGRLRDFMSLVREIAIRGLMDEVDVVSSDAVEAVIDDLRREKEGGLNADEIAELQRVLKDPKHRLPGGEVALGLLDKHLLLAYPNESTWYLPHPVLTLKLL
ncbi:MAG: hypothetical protein AAGF11_12760 [Myxococcota bacterium]